jgi:hypothetical protein
MKNQGKFNKQLLAIPALLLAVFLFANNALAHPGRTDGSGCHICRTNCASWGLSSGEYHCHNAKTAPQPQEPIKSTYGAGGTGYTSPAPEYKNGSSNQSTKKTPTESQTQKTTASLSKENTDNWLGWLALLSIGGGIGYAVSKNKKS